MDENLIESISLGSRLSTLCDVSSPDPGRGKTAEQPPTHSKPASTGAIKTSHRFLSSLIPDSRRAEFRTPYCPERGAS